MKHGRSWHQWIAGLVLTGLAWLSVACGGQAPTATGGPAVPTGQGGAPPAETATVAPSPTATMPPTATPTQPPSPIPTWTPTPLYQANAPISVDNVGQLQPLVRVGRAEPLTLVWSPDGQTLAVGSRAGIHLLDGDTLETLAVLDTGGTDTIRFSPDGRWLAEGFNGRLHYEEAETDWLTIWDLSDNTLVVRLDLKFNAFSFQFLPEESSLVVTGITTKISPNIGIVSYRVHIQRFDLQSGRSLSYVTYQPPGEKFGSSWLIDGGRMVFVKGERAFRWLDVHTGQVLYEMAKQPDYSQSTAVGTWLAYTDQEKAPQQVRLIDAKTQEVVRTLRVDEPIDSLFLAPENDGWLCAQLETKRICWDLATLKVAETRPLPAQGVWQVNPVNGRVVQFLDRSLVLKEADGTVLAAVEDFFNLNHRVRFSPDGQMLAVFNSPADGGLWLDLFDTATMHRRAHVPLAGPDTRGAGAHMDFGGGFIFAVEGDHPLLYVVDPQAGSLVATISITGESAIHLDAATDGSRVLVGSNIGLYMVSWPGGQVDTVFDVGTFMGGVALDEAGQTFLASDGNVLQAYSLPDADVPLEFLGAMELSANPIKRPGSDLWAAFNFEQQAVAFFRLLEPGGETSFEDIWLQPVLLLPVGECRDFMEMDMAFSPNGQLLALSCHANRVQLWDVETGTLVRELELPFLVTGFDFSPDGTLLATTTIGGELTFWSVP